MRIEERRLWTRQGASDALAKHSNGEETRLKAEASRGRPSPPTEAGRRVPRVVRPLAAPASATTSSSPTGPRLDAAASVAAVLVKTHPDEFGRQARRLRPHPLHLVRSHLAYYNNDRPHMSLAGDAPASRNVEPPAAGKVVALPRVGGLHRPRDATPTFSPRQLAEFDGNSRDSGEDRA